jgi:hypothetical protein
VRKRLGWEIKRKSNSHRPMRRDHSEEQGSPCLNETKHEKQGSSPCHSVASQGGSLLACHLLLLASKTHPKHRKTHQKKGNNKNKKKERKTEKQTSMSNI